MSEPEVVDGVFSLTSVEGESMSKKKKVSGPSKMDRVRDLIGELGDDVQPATIVEECQTRWGVQLSPAMASTYKGSILRKKSGAVTGGGRNRKSAAGSVSLADVTEVAALVKRMGAEQVQQLVAAMQ